MRNREDILRDAETIYDFMAETDRTPVRADIILAAGSHDLRVPEHAAKLYLEGTAPLIVCTGGLGKITDGLWSTPEGDVFAGRCISLGVPKDAVIVERHATNTGENFSLSRKLLSGMGKNILLPKGNATRAQLATIIKAYVTKLDNGQHTAPVYVPVSTPKPSSSVKPTLGLL